MRKLLCAAAAALAAFLLPAAPAQADHRVGVGIWVGSGPHWDRGWRGHGWRGHPRWRGDWRRHGWHRPVWRRGHGWAPPRCRSMWWDGWRWRCRW